MLVIISLESFAPHKNIFGSSFPSFGQITTSSAKGITGLVVLPPNRVTSNCCVID